MKIVMVAHYYPPHIGGLEIVAQKHAQSLVKLGHEVVVITPQTLSLPPQTTFESGVKVIRVRSSNFFDNYFGVPYPLVGLGFLKHLFTEVKSADIIHIHDVFYLTSWFAAWTASYFHKPVVVTQHVAMVDHRSSLIMALQKLVYRFIGQSIFNQSFAIIVYNRIVKNFLIDRGIRSTKIHELRNGIDLDFFQPTSLSQKQKIRHQLSLPLAKPIVLFVGRLVSKKGYDKLYAAHSSEYDLVFVGTGQVSQKWHQTPGVHFVGPADHQLLRQYYQAADLFVFPAVGEIFTIVMQEAMACGLPVITTDDPGYATYDLDRHLISLIPATTPALKDEIIRVLSSPQIQRKMSRYSLSFSSDRFNWEKNFAPIIDLYHQIITSKPMVTVTTSWDDGHIHDLKLSQLLSKYQLPGTFYVSPQNREFDRSQLLTDIEVKRLSRNFEIGAHTFTHPRLATVTPEVAKTEIVSSKKYLEALLSKPVSAFCYPGGSYLPETIKIVKSAGFTMARTVDAYSTQVDPTSPFTVGTTVNTYDHWSDVWAIAKFVHFNPIKFFEYYHRWDKLAIAFFDRLKTTGGVFHLWGHSWEIENHHDWDRLESVFQHISLQPQVVYKTNSQLL